jgi:3-oxoacyl-[acyl-carrier protein] reductase
MTRISRDTKRQQVLANPMSLEGRRIIITGAGQGIGRSIAELALRLGACVGAVDVKEDELHAFAEAADGRVLALAGSVVDRDFARTAVARMVERFGDVDGLVNNAGIIRPAMIEDMTGEQWDAVIGVNLTGAFNFLQSVGQHCLREAKSGSTARRAIVNISSDGGRRGSIGQINYGASKSGMLGLTMSAAREWAKFGITVNSICFGIVETSMNEVIRGEKFRDKYMAQVPMGRWSTPEEAVPAVCFLLSSGASYITGQHLSVNGGFHIGF